MDERVRHRLDPTSGALRRPVARDGVGLRGQGPARGNNRPHPVRRQAIAPEKPDGDRAVLVLGEVPLMALPAASTFPRKRVVTVPANPSSVKLDARLTVVG
jgi:hypothetical protein